MSREFSDVAMLLEETEIKTVAENPVFKNRNEQIGSFGRFNLQYRKEGVEETEDTEEKQHPHPVFGTSLSRSDARSGSAPFGLDT